MNKYQEAFDYYWKVYNEHHLGMLARHYIDILQELVDKATPKKTIRFIDKFYVSPYKCPVCKTIPHTVYQKYCDECGQALDWSDEDDK
jgi:transcription initiation factor IIE alpha subunit